MPRPDIIWIYCDELRADALGCYGNAHFRPRTPNIDRIAETGVRFERCFTNSPVCVSSRMAKLCARYPEETGVYHNEAAFEECTYADPPLTFPEVFAQKGYATANFGKLHLARGMQPWGLHNSEGHPGGAVLEGTDPESILRAPGPRNYIGGRYTAAGPFPAEKITDNALAWMAEQTAPFLVRLSYLQPHTPVSPPAPFDSMYDAKSFPGEFPREAGSRSAFERRFSEICRGWELTEEQVRFAQSCYYGLTGWVDSQVGRVLDWLEAAGRLENTVLVFDSDHGASLGEFGCYGKHLYATRTHRIPRLVAWPGTVAGGQVREDICEGLDLARTLLRLVGIQAPGEFRGRDLFNSEEPEAVYSTIGFGLPWSKAFPYKCYGTWTDERGWPRRACVRTPRHRLSVTVRIDGRPAADEERDVFLVDCREDPGEIHNLAGKPEVREVEARLTGLLEAHLAGAVEDACVFDESVNERRA